MNKLILVFLLFTQLSAQAQVPDHTYASNIGTIKLHRYGDIYAYPVMTLNSADQLELRFDDMDADLKNYYYTFQLCNADWTPANIQPFDYIRGFQTNRIRTYRNSSVVTTRYTHYEVIFPERNSAITRSGNYLLKVSWTTTLPNSFLPVVSSWWNPKWPWRHRCSSLLIPTFSGRTSACRWP